MIKFERPDALWLLSVWLIPALGFIWFIWRRRKSLKQIADKRVWSWIMPDVPKAKHTVKFILVSLAFFLLVIALANPQVGRKAEKVKRKGVDLIVALDISNSMTAEDDKPNRLEKAKLFISRLIAKLDGDRIGIVLFAGNAYLQLPLTTDYSAAKTFLGTISVDLAPTQGTAIGDALSQAEKAFSKTDPKFRTVIIMSDGENHEGNAEEIAGKLAEEGTIIHTIGVGSPQGAPIPVKTEFGEDYKRDAAGSIVYTKLNEGMLQTIATRGKGKYFRMGQAGEVNTIMNELSSMEQKEFEEQVFTDYEDQFQGFLLVAILLLIIEYFVTERRNRSFVDWSIFNPKKS